VKQIIKIHDVVVAGYFAVVHKDVSCDIEITPNLNRPEWANLIIGDRTYAVAIADLKKAVAEIQQ
jgi:hypothetical protein